MLGYLLWVVLLLMLQTGPAAGFDWPEGWSREIEIGQTSRHVPHYQVVLSPEKEKILVGGEGKYEEMRIFVKKDGEKIFASPEYFSVASPRILIDDNNLWHVFYTARQGNQHKLIYYCLENSGEIITGEKKLFASNYRITNPVPRLIGEEVLLTWTSSIPPYYYIKYLTLTDGEINRFPQPLTEEGRGILQGEAIICSHGNIHLFWREIEGWQLNLYYQSFSSAGKPQREPVFLGILSQLDDNRRPVVDSRIQVAQVTGNRILAFFNLQDRVDGVESSSVAMVEVVAGEIPETPRIITPSFQSMSYFSLAQDGDSFHLAWVNVEEERFSPHYMQVDDEGNTIYGPQTMYLGTGDGFRPIVAPGLGGSTLYVWQEYSTALHKFELLSRNNWNPENPPLSYHLGFGGGALLPAYTYVTGVALLYALVQMVFRFYLIFSAFLLQYLLSFWQKIDYERYALHSSLLFFSLLFLFQDTIFDLLAIELSCGLFSVLAFILATVFTLIIKRGSGDWLHFNSATGLFFTLALWSYWNLFFSLLPHLIITMNR